MGLTVTSVAWIKVNWVESDVSVQMDSYDTLSAGHDLGLSDKDRTVEQ